MEQMTVYRTGLPPIRFTGVLIGKGTTRDHNSTRWTDVLIYRTKAGNYIAAIQRHTQWQGESDRFAATSKQNAAEIIEWLMEGGKELGKASQDAVEQAAKGCSFKDMQPDSGFQAAWGQTVE